MMKRYGKIAGFAVLILLSVQIFGYQIIRAFYENGIVDLSGFLEKFFLYSDGVQKISFYSCLSYFTILVLSLFWFLSGSVDCLRSYRSLILHRYRRKVLFLRHIVQSNYAYTAAVTIWIALCVLSVTVVYGMGHASVRDMELVVLLFVNWFLYFNICVLLKVYLTFRINEVYAMTLIAFVTVLLLFLDTKVMQISILTLGNLYDTLYGMAIQAVVYGILSLKLLYFMRHKDVL